MSARPSAALTARPAPVHRSVIALLAGWSALFVLFILLMTGLAALGMDMDAITRDRVEATEGPWETAVLANVGFVMWGAAGGVALLASMLPLRRVDRQRALLLGLGLIYLALDDALRIHEIVLPKAGVPERVTLAVYGAVAGVGFLRLLHGIPRPQVRVLLLLALTSFAASLALDQFVNQVEAVEDIFKLAGIATLLAFALVWARSIALPEQ